MAGFGKSNRILKKVEFDAVMSSASQRSSAPRISDQMSTASPTNPPVSSPATLKVVCPAFIVFAKPVSQTQVETPSSRLGLVVSRKVGNSPRRNLVKRIARENFRRVVLEQPSNQNADFVILARPQAGQLSRLELGEAMRSCLQRMQRRLLKERTA